MSRRARILSVSLLVGMFSTGMLFVNGRPEPALPDSVLKAVIEPTLISSVPADLGWCVLPEATLYAASREELASAARGRRPPVARIDADRAPVRTIFDNRATYSAVAVDPTRDEVILQDENLFQILVYGLASNTPPRASMTEPRRRIGGLKTKVEFNCGLYVDPASGDIYSVPNDTVDTLVIFSRKARGNVAPDRELSTPHGTYGIAVDETKQEMFLTVQHSNSVVAYRKMAQGTEKPLREIVGDATKLQDPHGIAVDSTRNLMFVVNYGNAKTTKRSGPGTFELPSITVYPLDASGDVAPLRVIKGEKTQLNWPAGMAVDPKRGSSTWPTTAVTLFLVFV